MEFSIARFWREKHSHYRLRGSKCRKCGKINYPPSTVCRYCGSRELEEVDLLEPGKVITWTTIYSAPEGYDEYRPIVIAIIELLKTKVRILSQLTDVEPNEIKPGMIVEPVLRRVNEDNESGLIYYGIKFRPALTQ